jgi:hypothetical protein
LRLGVLVGGLAWGLQAAGQAPTLPPSSPAAPTAASSVPFSFSRSVAIGRPARPALVKVEQTAEGVRVAADTAKVMLPLRTAQRADVQSVTLANGAVLAIARVSAEDGREAAALVGRGPKGTQIVWSGAMGMRGDPGERRSNVIEVPEPDGGKRDLVLAETDERARICGQPRTLLHARVVDPQALTLKPIALDRVGATSPAVPELVAREVAATFPATPLLPALRAGAVSSRTGGAEGDLRSERMTDGDAATFWQEGSGAGGQGEFATFQWLGAGRAIAALTFVLVPSGAAVPPLSVPRSLLLIGEDGGRLRVKLPADPKPGVRYVVQLDAPLKWRCLSLVLQDPTAIAGAKPGPAVLAEVQAFTDLDFGNGLPGLVAELAAGGARGGQAAQSLATLGAPAVAALQQAWPKLDAAGRLRATHVFGRNADADANARQALSTALDDSSPEVAQAATAALLAAGAAGRALLLPRVQQRGKAGDELAIALARRAPAEAADGLLAALAAEGGAGREALRRAIALACQHGGQSVLERVKAWAQGEAAGVSARAALALALARAQSGQDARPLAAEVAAATAPQATAFADLWRLVQAARALPAGEPLDAWLAQLAAHDEHWMLRAAALTALAERSRERVQDAARAALDDEYPRVRVAAIDALGARQDAIDALSTHATRDTWPMVRVAAVDALAELPGTTPVLRAVLDDSARLVRAAGIRGLTRIKQRDAWPLVKAKLEDPEEWREVLVEAIAFAGALCIHDARNALVGFVRKGVEPEASTRATELGLAALDSLRRLGGEPEKAALSLARSAAAQASFRAATEQPLPPGAKCAAPSVR